MRLSTATLASLLLVSIAGCGPRSPAPPQLSIATGGVGGVYYAYGTGLAGVLGDELGTRVTVLQTAASVENLRLVSARRADLGFTLLDAAALAVDGRDPFERPQPIAALARLYDNYTHLVVDADLPVTHLSELRGRTVSTGADGSGTELMAQRLLELVGIRPDRDIDRRRLSLADSAEALRTGQIAAFFWSGGLPTDAITALARSTPIRLVNLAEYVDPLRARYGELFTELSIPASTYGLSQQVATIGVPNVLIVHKDMDTDLAEVLTRLLFESRDRLIAAHPEAQRLNRGVAVHTYPLTLHPGAAAYYRASKAGLG